VTSSSAFGGGLAYADGRSVVQHHVEDGLLDVAGDSLVYGDLPDLACRLAVFVEFLGPVDAEQELLAQLVDRLALLVHDVVVFEQVLAHVEVSLFDLSLRVLNAARDPRMDDGLVVRHPHALHEGLDAVPREDAHEIVFERKIEAAGARIALTTGATTQLIVDAARLVALGA
jgi:hypothetical protein